MYIGEKALLTPVCHHQLALSVLRFFYLGASLVAQWLGIRLPMCGTLVWEDPTCHGATKPVRHSYWTCALQPASHNYWARMPQLLKPVCLEPCSTTREATPMRSPRTTTKSSPHLPQLEKAQVQQQRPNAAKKMKTKKTVWEVNSLKKKDSSIFL